MCKFFKTNFVLFILTVQNECSLNLASKITPKTLTWLSTFYKLTLALYIYNPLLYLYIADSVIIDSSLQSL